MMLILVVLFAMSSFSLIPAQSSAAADAALPDLAASCETPAPTGWLRNLKPQKYHGNYPETYHARGIPPVIRIDDSRLFQPAECDRSGRRKVRQSKRLQIVRA
jgi:hypothetical protein